MKVSIDNLSKMPLLVAVLLTVSSGTVKADKIFDTVAATLASVNRNAVISTHTISSEQSALKAAVAPSDPAVDFEYLWPGVKTETNRWSAGISQEIPDFRKMKATNKVVTALDEVKEWEIQADYRNALYEARKKLIEYIGAKRKLQLLQEIHDNIDSLTTIYTHAWERGEVSILDLNKIKIEHARINASSHDAESHLEALAIEIQSLSEGKITAEQLSDITDYPLFINLSSAVVTTPKDTKTCQEHAITEAVNVTSEQVHQAVMNSPQYKLLEARLKVADAKLNLASKSRFPKFSIGYSHAYEDGVHFNGLTAGMTLPVFSRKSEKQAAEYEVFAQTAEKDMQLTEMLSQANADYTQALTLECQLRMLGPAVESTNSIRLLSMALKGGELSLLNYLQETSYFTEATMEYNEARLEYAQTQASLARYFE